MKRPRTFHRMVGVVGSWLVLVAPAAGDWLVTRDGARVETQGPWDVKGRQVVFTRPNGTLSALRLDDVDLEASERATDNSQQETPPRGEAPEAPPVLVLTNDDLPAQRPAARAERPEKVERPDVSEPVAAPETTEPETLKSSVEVTSWRADPSGEVGGLDIAGVVRNTGADIAANVTVAVTIVDEDGATLLETDAFLSSSGIAPGGSTTFKALLPGIVQLVVDPIFAVRALEVTAATAPSSGAGGTEGDAAVDAPPSIP